MASPVYSVIIPVYNAEKTLERCVRSLLDQKHDNAELILVDDGSSDASPEICDRFAAADAAVRSIHQENRGVSAARNAGIDASSGEYLLFVDSDDYVSGDLFDCADRERSEFDYDLIHFSSRIERLGEIRELRRLSRFSSSDHDAVLNRLTDSILHRTINTPWAKIYKRSIIHDYQVRFPAEAAIGEDWAFNVLYAIHVKSLCCSESVVYFVDISNENSLSRKEKPDQEKQLKYVNDIVNDGIRNSDLSAADQTAYFTAFGFSAYRSVYSKSKRLHLQGKSWAERNKELWSMCRQVNRAKAKHPNKLFCWKFSLPVRFYMTWLIDAGTKRRVR